MASAANATSLEGKVALVAGSAGGIGRAIALAYGGAGASVVCSDVNEAALEETAAGVEKAGGRHPHCLPAGTRGNAGPTRVLRHQERALFLASDGSSFMTGADLLVDGGYTAI